MGPERATSGSFTELYDTHAPAVTRYLARLTGSLDEAEDLAQETFLKALRHWDQLEDGARAPAWLFSIARNVAYDGFRRRRRNPSVALTDATLERLIVPDQSSRLGDTELIQAALRALPSEHRQALLLQSVAGYPLEAIAARLGWKLGTVKSRLSRARARFRAHYNGP